MFNAFWCRRTTAAALTVFVLASVAACGAAVARPSGASDPQRTSPSKPVMAGPGQAGTRSQVPWKAIGPGWALAQMLGRRSEALYLVDPIGGKYDLGAWPGFTLVDWSTDGTMALFASAPVRKLVPYVYVMHLQTGKVTRLRISGSEEPVGFTGPPGNRILMLDEGTTHGRLLTVSRQGRQPRTFWRGVTSPGNLLYTADGRMLAIDNNGTTELISSSTGRLIRKLAGPQDCSLVRWWTPGSLLADCAAGPPTGPVSQPTRLWLVPLTGNAAVPVGPAPAASGFYQNALGAWQLASGTYLTGSGGQCGFVARLEPSSSLRPYHLSGTGSVTAVAATRTQLLVLESRTCQSFLYSLSWYNPSTGTQTPVIPGGPQAGVLTALAFPADSGP